MDLGNFIATGRDAQMRALFKKGEATSKEILTVEFGHFPPQGLDFEDTNNLDRAVTFKTPLQDKKSGWLTKALTSVAALGYVHGKENLVGSSLQNAERDETIYMNPLLMGTVGKVAAALIAYKLTRDFMTDLSVTGMAQYVMNHQFLALTVLATSLRHTPLVQIFGHPFRSFSDVAGHEHIHILQVHDSVRAKSGYAMDDDEFKKEIMDRQKEFPLWRRVMNRVEDVIALGATRYLLNDVEVQARMHTVMVDGYQRWGRLPRTREEFIAACVDSGLNVDKDVKKEIESLSPEQKETFLPTGLTNSFARAVRGFVDIDAVELNAAQRRIHNAEMKHEYWDEQMPFMYGHLLKLYGDPKGLEKMDFDDSKPGVLYLDLEDFDLDDEIKKLTGEYKTPPPVPEMRPAAPM
jgi:hypothetical protein